MRTESHAINTTNSFYTYRANNKIPVSPEIQSSVTLSKEKPTPAASVARKSYILYSSVCQPGVRDVNKIYWAQQSLTAVIARKIVSFTIIFTLT
jgi:hypothetical protein